MNKKSLYAYVTVIALAFLSNACAATGKDDDQKPSKPHPDEDKISVTLKVPKSVAKDAEIFIVIGKGGKLEFVGAKDKELRKYHVGEKRPIRIKDFLPKEKIETLDQITIFSGSPSCIIRDGWIICS